MSSVAQLHELCDVCFQVRAWLERPASFEGGTLPQLRHTLDGLKESSTSGCHLCTMLLWDLDKPSRDPGALRLTVDLGDSKRPICLRDSTGAELSSPRIRLTNRKAPCAVKVPYGTNASDEAMRHVQASLHECLTSHKACISNRNSKRFYPTRLLDTDAGLEGKQICRLVMTEAETPTTDYVALSYCWGVGETLVLKKANLDEFRSKLPAHELPKTLQDAIYVTRSLGYRYIWIDAICIIQDDASDWRREASKMCQVYENAILTIAALDAKASSEGFLTDNKRNPLAYQACALARLRDKYVEVIPPVLSSFSRTFYHSTFVNAPLNSRAWVIQERILSPRSIYIGHQIVWECQSKIVTDAFDHNHNRLPDRTLEALGFQTTDVSEIRSNHFPHWHRFKVPSGFTDASRASTLLVNDANFSNLEEWWSSILEGYSESHLTYETDRYIAISGVIDDIHRRTNIRNIAGLWEPFLLQQLLWLDGRATPKYNSRAPSWSWLSFEGRVNYIGRDDPGEQAYTEIRWLTKLLDISHRVEPNPDNERETILIGKLFLKGPVLPVESLNIERRLPMMPGWSSNSWKKSTVTRPHPGPFAFLVLRARRRSDEWTFSGLIMGFQKGTHDASTFVRVGCHYEMVPEDITATWKYLQEYERELTLV